MAEGFFLFHQFVKMEKEMSNTSFEWFSSAILELSRVIQPGGLR